MLSPAPVMQPVNSHPPDLLEVLSSMCQLSQPYPPQPIARWILEEGQVLGVLIASFSSPLCRDHLNVDAPYQTFG